MCRERWQYTPGFSGFKRFYYTKPCPGFGASGGELAQIEKEIEKMLESFDYKLTTLPGVGNAIASKLIL